MVVGCHDLGVDLVIKISHTHKYMFSLPSISVWVTNNLRPQTTNRCFCPDMYCDWLLYLPVINLGVHLQLVFDYFYPRTITSCNYFFLMCIVISFCICQ